MEYQLAAFRNMIVAGDKSIAERLRVRRWAALLAEFPDFREMDVLDLGGKTVFWTRAPVRPRSVTLINLKEHNASTPWIRALSGDALDAPGLLAGRSFDLVISNSLIEHLGGHLQRLRFAEVARSMAPRYVVQTPYRHFPIEPHWLFPFMQYLPLQARLAIAEHWPLGMTKGWPRADVEAEVLFTEMLTRAEFAYYFPDATMRVERFGGLIKSMTMIR